MSRAPSEPPRIDPRRAIADHDFEDDIAGLDTLGADDVAESHPLAEVTSPLQSPPPVRAKVPFRIPDDVPGPLPETPSARLSSIPPSLSSTISVIPGNPRLSTTGEYRSNPFVHVSPVINLGDPETAVPVVIPKAPLSPTQIGVLGSTPLPAMADWAKSDSSDPAQSDGAPFADLMAPWKGVLESQTSSDAAEIPVTLGTDSAPASADTVRAPDERRPTKDVVDDASSWDFTPGRALPVAFADLGIVSDSQATAGRGTLTPVATDEVEPSRNSDVPPEVDPDDLELSEPPTSMASPSVPPAPPRNAPAISLRPAGAIPAAIVTTAPAPPPSTGQPSAALLPAGGPQLAANDATRKRVRYWWEELFGDDFLRTMDRLSKRQIDREVTFMEERLGLTPGAVVLDLACGTGRHAVELSVRGYSVVGFDLSLPALSRAADEAQSRGQKINFLQGDMREMGFEGTFDAVVCWSTSFGYFEDERNVAVAQRVHRALRPGGMLLLDVVNRDFVTHQEPSLVWFEGDGCVAMDEMKMDFITSRLKVKRMVMLEDGRQRELDYSIRLYSLHELGRILHDVGFRVLEVSGNPASPGAFFGADSPRIIIVAEKA